MSARDELVALPFDVELAPGAHNAVVHWAELGSEREIAYVDRILEEGSGADRQLRVFHETNDLKQVVDYMISETEYGLFGEAAQ